MEEQSYSTLILGSIMAFIAFQQWRTTECQRRTELLKKRIDLYEKIRFHLIDIHSDTRAIIDLFEKHSDNDDLLKENIQKSLYPSKDKTELFIKDFQEIRAIFDEKTENLLIAADEQHSRFVDDMYFNKLKKHTPQQLNEFYITPALQNIHYLEDYIPNRYLVIEKKLGMALYDGIRNFIDGIFFTIKIPFIPIKYIMRNREIKKRIAGLKDLKATLQKISNTHKD